MTQIQIIAIRKPTLPDHHSAITDYRWKDSSGQIKDTDRLTMVNWIQQNRAQHKAYVVDSRGDVAYCRVEHNIYGTYYLETQPDGIKSDNLLALPRF
jgi:hypothetical protein